nr:hypothetical protein [uncultured bacterium]ASV47025.1 hypothetical protein [uncultured bacterium]
MSDSVSLPLKAGDQAVSEYGAWGTGHETATNLAATYSLRTRLTWAGLALLSAILLAGFWNFPLVDGFGRDFVAGPTIGDTQEAAASFASRGALFGIFFGAIAGLAATFTACNCVVFAIIPGLACADRRNSIRRSALHALAILMGGVTLIGILYGVFIGFLGPEGIQAFNTRAVRIAQAQIVFSAIGLAMLFWGALEFGFLPGLVARCSPATRAFFAQPTTRAALMGLMVGLFMVGRPYPLFRDFLTYAAESQSPLYGAAIMMVQGLGQIAVMVVLFLVLVYGFGDRLQRWMTAKPARLTLISAASLSAGGMYFLYYWGIARIWDLGSWGFKLGWY